MLNTETLVRHCLVGAHAAGCAQAEPQTATDDDDGGGDGAGKMDVDERPAVVHRGCVFDFISHFCCWS